MLLPARYKPLLLADYKTGWALLAVPMLRNGLFIRSRASYDYIR